ncbi:Nif3-like dinuclear metal center hexameric protein [Flavihumibacter rivuli]|uniref:Nif3-like dinuclear metal center hexameric protein n=1 Tax=Flavihumibacter rivuli TaxID=2838156 RepID=UPI001BDF41F5|nr:Nif3-like dinuclear metal center hexameric protein [Flavihumibacter rivuli]ULQ58268.1 Nif3-like dinuclear metal center hexameric protein [Flavihumibacter rivuli]
MLILDIINCLERIAPPIYQESYDNAGLLTGSPGWTCTGAIIALDATEEVVMEAVAKGCNLVVAHHPILFGGLKKINGKNYVEKAVISAIKNDIAIYAIHTNLDNVAHGVNRKIADLVGLANCRILSPKVGLLKKLYTFVPHAQLAEVSSALFAAGAGHIGNYSECSYFTDGTGTYKAGEGAQPFAGEVGLRHHEPESRLEVIFPVHLESAIVKALRQAHPYEEVAYDIVPLANQHNGIGSGMIGDLPEAMPEQAFLNHLKQVFGLSVIRHTRLLNKPVRRVAVCGGAGSFLISSALNSGADAYITADVKYHEFFDANDMLLLADIGHFESEQFTVDLLYDILAEKFPTFAVFKTEVRTNPVYYHT